MLGYFQVEFLKQLISDDSIENLKYFNLDMYLATLLPVSDQSIVRENAHSKTLVHEQHNEAVHRPAENEFDPLTNCHLLKALNSFLFG